VASDFTFESKVKSGALSSDRGIRNKALFTVQATLAEDCVREQQGDD